MKAWRRTGTHSTPSTTPPPLPVSGSLDTIFGTAEITFDTDLEPGHVDLTNWSFTDNAAGGWIALTAEAGSNQVTFSVAPGGPAGIPAVANYQPPPFDVLSLAGAPAQTFLLFPIVVT